MFQYAYEERFHLLQIIVKIRHVFVPARAFFRAADCVWVNVRTTRRREHRKAFTEGTDQCEHHPLAWLQLSNFFGHLLRRTTTAIANMMQLVCESVLEFLFAYGGVEVKKNRWISFYFEDKTIFSWLNDRIDFRSDTSLFRQICQC